ncbi:hypothetical protein [Alysiella crassa]|uniref:hypothetical protein n=1 Tax=Alysiella crassa TaxID=153491 RepID=UPI001FD61C92|nr:hypothetical protein [Alysiella crassa]UOP06093.1 hypothetical protein LVJ80_09650 [Alysiella crassa]
MRRAHQNPPQYLNYSVIWYARRTLHFCDWKNCRVLSGCLKKIMLNSRNILKIA